MNIKAGDAAKLIQELPKDSVDLILSRLPRPQKGTGLAYRETESPLIEGNYPHWLQSLLYHAWFVLKDNGNVLLQVQSTAGTTPNGDVIARARGELQRAGWFECEKFVWANDAGQLLQNIGPWRQYEEILWFRKNNLSTQYRIEKGHKRLSGLYESLIGTFTQEGDTLLDLFAGMGDIVVVANKMKRKFIALERDEDTVTALKLRISTSRDFEEEEQD